MCKLCLVALGDGPVVEPERGFPPYWRGCAALIGALGRIVAAAAFSGLDDW
jgi:hypothetical protein